MRDLARELEQVVVDPIGAGATAPAPYIPLAERRSAPEPVALEPVVPEPASAPDEAVLRVPVLVSNGSGLGSAGAAGPTRMAGMADLDGDHEEQERFDRFFSEDIETEPSRTWLEG